MADELIQHGVLVSKGSWSKRRALTGRDAMDGSFRFCGAKEIASSVGGSLLAFDGDLGSVEGCFPRRPVFGSGGKAVPVQVLFQEAARYGEGGRYDGDKPGVYDWEANLSGLLLQIFHLDDVFWDARIGIPEVNHFLDKWNDVSGIKTSAAQGDLVEELVEGPHIVLGGSVFHQEHPGLFYNGLEEEATKTLNGLDEVLLFELGRVEQLSFDLDGVGGVVLDVRVVRWERNDEAVKRAAPFYGVLGVGVKKVRETIDAAWNGNGLEEVGEDLSDLFDIVGWGARDGWEVCGGVGKEGSWY